MDPFPPGKGGGDDVEYGHKGKGVTIHSLVEGEGRPLAVGSTAANADERHQVGPLLDAVQVKTGSRGRPKKRPRKLQGDKGYDSKAVRQQVKKRGIQPQISRRVWPDRKQPRGRKPQAGKDRWKVERTFSWYQRKFRRLVVRWERRRQYWQGFLLLAAAFIWVGVLVG